MHRLPIEAPHRAVPILPGRRARRKKSRHQRRVRPVEEPRRHTMMLRRDEQLPVVVRPRCVEMRARITDEVPKDMLLEIRFRVRRIHSSQSIERRQQRSSGVCGSVIHAGVTAAAGLLVRLGRRDAVEKLPQRVYDDGADGHARAVLARMMPAHRAVTRYRCSLRTRTASAAIVTTMETLLTSFE